MNQIHWVLNLMTEIHWVLILSALDRKPDMDIRNLMQLEGGGTVRGAYKNQEGQEREKSVPFRDGWSRAGRIMRAKEGMSPPRGR